MNVCSLKAQINLWLSEDQIVFLTLVIRVMVKPNGFKAPETDAVYPLGHLIGNFEINQGLLNFKHQVDILTGRLARLPSARYRCGSLGFDSRTGQIGTVSPTTRHRCDVSSELCCTDAKLRRWTPPLVTRFGVIRRV